MSNPKFLAANIQYYGSNIAYTAQQIRELAQSLPYDFIRMGGIESITQAKSKKAESIESRIPDEWGEHFTLGIHAMPSEKPGMFDLIQFDYRPGKGYFFTTGYRETLRELALDSQKI